METKQEVNEKDFSQLLKKVAQKDTSADPEGWTEDNPLWGHCAVAALLAQDYFGGELMRGSLEGISKYAHLRSHYWNRLPNGEEVDFTAEQYPDLSFIDLKGEVKDRERVLDYPNTIRRYNLLKELMDNIEENKNE